MVAKMIKFELSRLTRRRKLLLLGVLGVAALVGGVVSYLSYATPLRTSFEAFSFATGLVLPLLLPLLAGLSTGDILVEDHRQGVQTLILSRGVLPSQYVFAKAMGSFVGQFCFIGILLIAFFLVIVPFFPVGPISEYAADFARDLATNNPVLYCLVLLLIYATSATAFSGLALLTSVWVKNVFIVMIAPVVLYIAALYFIGTASLAAAMINPYVNLMLNDSSGLPFTLQRQMIYWLVLSAATHALAVVAFSLRRDYA